MFITVTLMILFSAEILLAGAEWQNRVDYKIKVRLDDIKHFLNGEERLTYYNNSPVTLNRIWLLLYPNAYKNETTVFAKELKRQYSRSFHFSKLEDRGHIKFESLKIGEDDVIIVSPNDSIEGNGDNARLRIQFRNNGKKTIIAKYVTMK